MMKRIALLVACGLLFAHEALAQNEFPTPSAGKTVVGTQGMVLNGSNQAVPVSSTNPVPVSGSFSASLGTFAPGTSYANLTATGSSARAALPTGTTVVAYNSGTTAVSCALGNGSVVAVANEDQIAPGGFLGLVVGANVDIACIDQTGSASNVVVLSGGTGLPSGSGGGGGGSGGGSVTQGTTPWVVGQATGTSLHAVLDSGTVTANAGTNLNTSALATDAHLTAPQANAGSDATKAFAVQGVTGGEAVPVDGSGVTQPISGSITTSQGSVTTPTDNAGNPLYELNCNGSGQSCIPVDAIKGGVAQGSATSGQTGSLTQCAVTTSPPTYAAGQTDPENCDTAGNRRVITTTGSTTTVTGNPGVSQSGTWTVQPGNTPNTTPWLASNTAGGNTQTVKAASTSAALTDLAAVVALSPNPAPVCTGVLPINQTTGTDLHTFTNIGYLCGIVLVSATAQNIGLIEGTGTVCATGTAALIGGTTASMAVAANGGFSAVADRTVMKMVNSADHLCVVQSSSGNVSGFITYVDHS